jgi:hypothetical protein
MEKASNASAGTANKIKRLVVIFNHRPGPTALCGFPIALLPASTFARMIRTEKPGSLQWDFLRS